MTGMRLVDYLTIAGLILGPVFSVLISIYFERLRQQRFAKENTLRMFLRSKDSADTEEFSIAIKSIPIDFRKNPAVRLAYEDYLANLAINASPEEVTALMAIRDDKLASLIAEMLISLGYTRLEARQIARSKYVSQGYVNVKQMQGKVMQSVISISDSAKSIADQLANKGDYPGLDWSINQA